MSELVRYDAMCRAIDAAYAVDEVKAIHDQARMLEAAARVAKNTDAEDRAYQIRWRAANKVGELSKKIEKAQGQRSDLRTSGDKRRKSEVLEEAGISPREASNFERLSEVPSDEFEAALATKWVRDLIDKPTPVEGDALAKAREWGRRINDFSGIMAAVNAQIADMIEFARLWKDGSEDEKRQIGEILDWREVRKVLRHARNSNEFRVHAFGRIYNSLMGFDRERAP